MSQESRYHVSPTIQRQIQEKYNNKCCFCGKILPLGEGTVEHLIPSAVSKWMDIPPIEFRTHENLAWSCHRCNVEKSSHVLSLKSYMRFDIKGKKEFRIFYQKYEEQILRYNKLKRKVLYRCNAILTKRRQA